MDSDHFSPVEPPETIPPLLPEPDRKPWGFWATFGLGLAIFVLWITVQSFAGGIFFFLDMIQVGGDAKDIQKAANDFQYNGVMIGVSSLVSMPVMLGGCWLFAALRRKHGISVKEYLGLEAMGWKSWILLPVAAYVVMFGVGHLLIFLGAPEINPWMKDMAEKVTNFWFLAIAVIFCAPIIEEFLFRGFLFKGWMHSKLGIPGTIALTSFLWTIIHLQYDIYGLVAIFTLGILLGYARVLSKSIWAPIWIHFLNNAYATYEMVKMLNESSS